MKINDYWRLAKISLKARKKSTRSTIRGISISLILIVPVIFAIIALYASVLPQLNKNPESLYAIFTSGQKGFTVADSSELYNYSSIGAFSDYSVLNNYSQDRNSAFDEIDKEFLHYTLLTKNMYTSDGKLYERIQIDGENKPLRIEEQQGDERQMSFSMAVVDKDNLDMLQKSKYGVLGDSFNKGFTGNGARQVILDRSYLKLAGLEDKDVYGKKISIFVRESTINNLKFFVNDEETTFVDHYLFRDFEVVGIIGDGNKWHSMPNNNDINQADIIVSGASYYGLDGTAAIVNKVGIHTENNYGYYKYDFGDEEAKNIKAKDYIFTGAEHYGAYINMAKQGESNSDIISIEKNCYKYIPDKNGVNPYGDLSEVISEVYPYYKSSYDSKLFFELSGIASDFYTNFSMLNFILTIVMSILGVFAGIVLFAALVNLFNTIMHSVNSRKNYLGVMRAIGAKSSVIPKLYLFEVLRIFAWAFLWIAIIGGGICIGIKVLFDLLFNGGYAMGMGGSSIVISISWGMIPVALLAVLGILIVIGLVYSIGCSYKMSRKPIMEVLEG